MPSIHFMAARKPPAQRLMSELIERYGQAELEDAAYVVTVGGDGTTLDAMRAVLAHPHVPVFSMRTGGSVGALGNPLACDGLTGRLTASRRIVVRPLQFTARTTDGSTVTGLAINEVVIIRQRFQAARLRVQTDADDIGLFGDGIVVASAIGSTGYCASLGGPSLPLGADMLALTGIAVRRPREGLHAALPGRSVVRIGIEEPQLRPARVETHDAIVTDVCEVVVTDCSEPELTLLLERGEGPHPGDRDGPLHRLSL